MKDREQEREAKREKAIKEKILAKQLLNKVTVKALKKICEKEHVELTVKEKTKKEIAQVLLRHWTKGAQ